MDHQKKSNLLNESSDSKFVNRNWNIVTDQWNTNYSLGNEIIYSAKVLKLNLCNYNNNYNDTPLPKSITQINVTSMNDAEELDLVMSMYNFVD